MEIKEAIECLKGCVVSEERENGRPTGNVTCDLTREVLGMAISALEKQEKSGVTDKNGREIKRGDRLKCSFGYADDVVGTCEYSDGLAAWGILLKRRNEKVFRAFCDCYMVMEWEVEDGT